MLLLELGDASTGTADYAGIKAKVYTKVFPLIGYDAIGLGEWELRYMREAGVALPYGESVPTICANAVDAGTDRPLAGEPYIVKKMPSGLRVGIISVVGDKLLDEHTSQRLSIKILPPADVLRKYIKELRSKSDLVVLLSHTQMEAAKALATEVTGIDVVLSGHISPNAPEAPEQVGNSILMHTRSSGKYVGKLVLDIDADRRITAHEGGYQAMDSEVPDDADMGSVMAMHDTELAQYYARMRGGMMVQTQVGPKRPQPFVSSQKCRECHMKEFIAWSNTDHSRAFASLRKDNRMGDPECLSCHTTGFKYTGGFESMTSTPKLQSVQCESCHGPGVRHARRPGKGYGMVMELTCTQCHDQANSPGFDYEKYKAHVTHANNLPSSTASDTGRAN